MSQPPGPAGPHQQQPAETGYDLPHSYQPPDTMGYPTQQPWQPAGQYPYQGPSPGQYEQPGEHPPGYDPFGQQQKRDWLPWILGGAGALVVLAGVIVLVVVMLGYGGEPERVADDFVTAMNERDAEALLELGCDNKGSLEEGQAALDQLDLASRPGMPPEARQIEVRFERGGVTESGDTAGAEIDIMFENVPAQLTSTMSDMAGQLTMKNDGGWCVSDFSERTGTS